MTKRALWREFVTITWHLPTMTWPEFLALSVGDRFVLLDELGAMITRHNEESGIPRDRH